MTTFISNYEKNKINNLAIKRPDLLEFWNYEKNTENPFEITCGSAKKVWWNCNFCEDTYPMSLNKKQTVEVALFVRGIIQQRRILSEDFTHIF